MFSFTFQPFPYILPYTQDAQTRGAGNSKSELEMSNIILERYQDNIEALELILSHLVWILHADFVHAC